MTIYKVFVQGMALGAGCVQLPNYKTQIGQTANPSACYIQPQAVGYCSPGDYITRVYEGSNFLGNDGGTLWLSASLSFELIPDEYDCINGQCVVKSEYGTPGIYKSRTDCQAVCANGGACAEGKKCVDPTTFCPDGKVCIDQGEFSSIEALISKIGSEVC